MPLYSLLFCDFVNIDGCQKIFPSVFLECLSMFQAITTQVLLNFVRDCKKCVLRKKGFSPILHSLMDFKRVKAHLGLSLS